MSGIGTKMTAKLLSSNSDGSVILRTVTGKIKQRKGQNEENYQIELNKYHSQGPLIQDNDYLINPSQDFNVPYNNEKAISKIQQSCLDKLYFETCRARPK